MRWLRITAVALLLLPVQLWADTWDVYEGESIQAAIDMAQPGDDVLVHQGTYPESLALTSGVTVHSAPGEDATIERQDALYVVRSWETDAQALTFEGFTIRGGFWATVSITSDNMSAVDLKIYPSGSDANGLDCSGDNTHLEDIRVYGPASRGIRLYGWDSGPVLDRGLVKWADEGVSIAGDNCTVRLVTADSCYQGFSAWSAGGAVCEDDTTMHCDYGVYVYAPGTSYPPTFRRMAIKDCTYGAWFKGWPPLQSGDVWAYIDDSTFRSCHYGIWVDHFAQGAGNGHVRGCVFEEIYDTGVTVSDYGGGLSIVRTTFEDIWNVGIRATENSQATIGGTDNADSNHFAYVDGTGIELVDGAQATVQNCHFYHVLGTGVLCETGTDGTLIRDCTLDGSGGCFEGIAVVQPSWAMVRRCKTQGYDFIPVPPWGFIVGRGVYVYGPAADLGHDGREEAWGKSSFENPARDLYYSGAPQQIPSTLWAERNWWGEAPPDSDSFAGRWKDHIDYDPWLTGPPPGVPPVPGDDSAVPQAIALSTIYPNPALGAVCFS
jgi:hypothetical protein